jgi:hypothetical protein
MADTGFGLLPEQARRTAVSYSNGKAAGAVAGSAAGEIVSRYDASWDVKMSMPDGGKANASFCATFT